MLNDNPVLPEQYHVRIRMNPRPIMATKAQSSTETLLETGLHQTPEFMGCHHFVTCCGHPSRCWPRSPFLNFRDQETLHGITRKGSSLVRQYKYSLYCPLHFPFFWEASSRNLSWVLFECLTQRHQPFITTTCRSRTQPGPNTSLSSSWRHSPSSPDDTTSVYGQ
jgi:hypothetical protein